jgi:hypothetical protein
MRAGDLRRSSRAFLRGASAVVIALGRAAARVLALVVIAGCSTVSTPQLSPSASGPVVDAVVRNVRDGKPGLRFCSVDVELRNPSREPRWLVIPWWIPHEGEGKRGLPDHESGLESYLLSARPRLVLVEASAGNFYAVRLPGGGSVLVRGLTFYAFWREAPKSVALEVLVAREITAGGVPLEGLLGGEVTSESGAFARVPEDQRDYRILHSWNIPRTPSGEYRSVPLAVSVESRVEISAPLPSRYR